MEIRAFFVLVTPFIIVFYVAFLLFLQPPRAVVLASLIGGLVMGLVNMVVDLLAYYAHWWHYTLNDLILHLPIPFYITPILIYGALAYLLIWRFWRGRGHWFALLLLFSIPVFGILRDIYGAVIRSSYVWDNPLLATSADIIMWLVMFYGGFLVFRRLAPAREIVVVAKQ